MSDFTFTATSKSADAPNVDPGICDARFDGVQKKFIEGGQFGDGDRLEWQFTLLDDDGAVLYDDGDPIEVQGLTSLSTNVLSKTTPKAVRYLKALMTPEEFAAFSEGKGVNASALIGRVVQVEVAIRDSGWPTIANVLPPRQKRVSRARSAADAERTTDGE